MPYSRYSVEVQRDMRREIPVKIVRETVRKIRYDARTGAPLPVLPSVRDELGHTRIRVRTPSAAHLQRQQQQQDTRQQQRRHIDWHSTCVAALLVLTACAFYALWLR